MTATQKWIKRTSVLIHGDHGGARGSELLDSLAAIEKRAPR